MALKTADHLLVVDDDPRMVKMLQRHLEQAGYRVTTAEDGREALEALSTSQIDLVLSDVRMPGLGGVELVEEVEALRPGTPVVLMTAFGTIESAVEAMQRGAVDYVSKPFKLNEILLVAQRVLEHERLREELDRLRTELVERWEFQQMIGKSRAMQRVFQTIERTSKSTSTVLITGETGTGKEMAARAIHRLSPLADRHFVVVDCSEIPDTLLESELFGFVRGAFTGADRSQRGLFEHAEGGTVFLDEVCCLSLAAQAKLLRVLEERSVRRLGSRQRIDLHLRFLAASNRDLKEEVTAGRFREDLYFRLNVLQVRLPPLRERREDVPLLAQHFLDHGRADNPASRVQGLDAEASEVLLSYSWPGNVRELANAIEHALALAPEPIIRAEDLPQEIRSTDTTGITFFADRPVVPLRDVIDDSIQQALEETGGNRTAAARLLGIDRRTLQRHLARLSPRSDP